MTRELTARRAAEAAEASRRAVVASFEERQAAVAAGNPSDEVERRALAKPARRSEARAIAATETRPRRLQVVRRTPDDDSGSSPPPQVSPAAAAAPTLRRSRSPCRLPKRRCRTPRVSGSHGWKVPLVRLVVALLVPAVVVARTVAQGRWWTDTGPVGWSVLALAMLLTVLGLGWVWFATDEPHGLLPRTRRAPEEAELSAPGPSGRCRSLCSGELRTGGPSTEEAWARFEAQTGLTVPSATRTVIDPAMDPACAGATSRRPPAAGLRLGAQSLAAGDPGPAAHLPRACVGPAPAGLMHPG